MVDSVAKLGITIDSTTVAIAAKKLEELSKTAKKTEKATDGLTGSTKKATDAIGRNEKATRKATDAINTETGAIGRNENVTRKSTNATQKATVTNINAAAASKRSATATQTLTQSQALNTKVTQGMTAAWRSMSVVVGAFAGIRGAMALRDISDESINIQNRLRQVTSSQTEMNATFEKLVKLSADTRVGLTSTSVLYQRLSLSSQDLGLSQEKLLRLTTTINKSFAISGATATEASGAIRQLSQGLAAGALRGDEFNSVAEQAPAIMRAIAKETNLSLGALREFAATGGITAEIVISALQNAEHEIDVNFAKSVATFGQQMEQINNQFIQWAANNDGLRNSMSALGAAIGVLATASIFLLENIDVIIVLTVAKLAPALIASASLYLKASAAAVIYSGSAGILATTLKLLGGPVGLAVIAAFAIFKFVDSLETAEERTSRLTAEVGDLSAQFKDLTASQLGFEKSRITEEFNKTHTAINVIKEDLIDLRIQNDTFDEMSEGAAGASLAIVKQEKAMKILRKELIRLGVAADTVAKAQGVLFDAEMNARFEAAAKITVDHQKALTKVFTKYGDLVSVIGMTARETLIYNDITRNSIDLKSKDGQALLILIDLHLKNIAAMAAAKKATKDLAKAAEDSARKQQKAYDDAFRFTSDLFEDTINNWEDGWQGFADNVVDIIKKMLARMVAEYAASGVLSLLGIAGANGGGLSSLGGAGASFLSGLGSTNADGTSAEGLARIANVGRSIYSGGASAWAGAQQVYGGFSSGGISGGYDAFGAATGLYGGASAGGAVLGGGIGGGLTIDLGVQASGFVTAVDGLANGLAEAAPWASALAGALQGYEQSGFKGAATGAAGGYLGAKGGLIAGAQIGSLVGPLGTVIGGAIGAVVGGILGSKLGASVFGGDYQTKDFGVQLAVAAGNLVAESFENQKKKGGLFHSDKRRTITRDLDFETNDAFASAVQNTQRQILNAYDVLGIELGNNVFKSFTSATVKISTKGKSDEQITAALNTYFEGITEQMVDHIGELSGITFKRLTELGAVLQFANTALDAFGADLLESSVKGAEAAENLVAIAGGFEAFQMSVTNFNNKFVEQRSDFEIASSVLNDVFGALGAELPATRQAVTDLVAGLDLMTESGQASFATITGLSNELDSFYSEVEQLEAQRLEQAAKLERELLKAQERAAAESLRIAEQLAADDLRIAGQQTSLDIELLNAQGATLEALAASRELELAAMDESLRATQERIFALQDEAEATRIASIASEALAAAAERIAGQQTSLDIELLRVSGATLEALTAERELELAAMDESLRATQERIFALQDEAEATRIAAAAADKLATAAERIAGQQLTLDIELLRASGDAVGALAAERERELAAMDESLRATQVRINTLEDEAEATRIADAEAVKIANELADAERELANVRKGLIDDANTAFRQAFDLARDVVAGNIDNLKSVSDAISNIIGVSNDPTRGAAKNIIRDAIGAAQGGVFGTLDDIAPALKVLGQSSQDSFASLVEFNRDQATTGALLKQLQDLTDDELTIQEQTLVGLDSLNASMTKLVEIENGTFVATLTLVDAVAGLSSALGVASPIVSSGGGLSLVSDRGPEMTGGDGSNILTVESMSAVMSDSSSISELQAIRAEIKSSGFAIALNTLQIRKMLDRWDGDGVPPERVVS